MIDWLGTSVEHCLYYGRGWLVLFSDVGDLMTFAAYLALPIALLIVMRRRDMMRYEYRGVALFAAFIVWCGVGHLIDIISLHFGATLPWLNVLATVETLITGLISVATAVFVFRMIPLFCSIPDPIEFNLVKRVLASYRETEFWEQLARDLQR